MRQALAKGSAEEKRKRLGRRAALTTAPNKALNLSRKQAASLSDYFTIDGRGLFAARLMRPLCAAGLKKIMVIRTIKVALQ